MAERQLAEGVDSRHLIQHLQQENERLAALVQQQQTGLLQRAEPMAQAVIDILNHWCDVAETPSHTHQAAAADLLKKWVSANDRVRAAASGIVLPGIRSNGSV